MRRGGRGEPEGEGQNNERAASVSRAALTEAACRWVGAIAPRAEGFSPAPRRKSRGSISSAGLEAAGSARFAPARSGAPAAPLAPRLRSVASRAARHACRGPPAPSAGEAPAVVPISDALAGSRAPPSGAPSPPTAAAPMRARFTRLPEARAGRAVFSDVAATRPRASRPLARCAGYPAPHRDRVESMLGSGAPRRLTGCHRAGQASPCGREPEASLSSGSCRRLPRRDASSEDVQTQLVKEHPLSRLDLHVAELIRGA